MADMTNEDLVTLTFDLRYTGDAVEVGPGMAARDLAPALAATHELFEEVNRIVRPTDPDVVVTVRATSDGSLSINLSLIYAAVLATLTSPGADAASNLMQILDFTGTLISFIKRKARGIVEIVPVKGDPEYVEVQFRGDETKVKFPKAVLTGEKNLRARRQLQEITRPLTRDGIESVRLVREEVVVGEIGRDDLAAFDVAELPQPEDVLSVPEEELWLTVLASHWPRGSKWRFTDGQVKFWAEIMDVGFWDRLDRGERFGKGDQIRCRLRRVQTRDKEGQLHTVTEIMQVLDHRPAAQPEQDGLFETE